MGIPPIRCVGYVSRGGCRKNKRQWAALMDSRTRLRDIICAIQVESVKGRATGFEQFSAYISGSAGFRVKNLENIVAQHEIGCIKDLNDVLRGTNG